MRSIWRRHIEGDWKNKNVPVQFVQLFFFHPLTNHKMYTNSVSDSKNNIREIDLYYCKY